MKAQPKDIPEAANVVGPAGSAWDCPTPPTSAALLHAWRVRAPWAHPLWSDYLITLVHLRPQQGLLDPIIHLPGATHEMIVSAMNPEATAELRVNRGDLLSPDNFAAQFIAADDEAAVQRVLDAVQEICDGKLNPDTDYAFQWIARFGANMMR